MKKAGLVPALSCRELEMLLPRCATYDETLRRFEWAIPQRFNIGVAVADVWAASEPQRPAILDLKGGALTTLTFGELRAQSNRLASSLRKAGVVRGDRVAILLPQMAEVVVSHVAIYKLGGVALPLASLFGADALEYRLKDAGVRALVTDAAGLAKLAPLRAALPVLQVIVSTDGADGSALSFAQLIEQGAEDFVAEDTSCDDPAMMIYTSGTTGPPKGALHGHRVLLGHLPGVQFPHEGFPQEGDRFWTPADWAWAGGLLNVLLPSLYFGVSVVARRFDRFDPEAALDLIIRLQVRNAFIPPTALRMLRSVHVSGRRYEHKLRTLASGGESLGAEIYDWGREAFGLTINEFYGQTECNLVLASSHAMGVSRAGAIGKAVPGHICDVIRADGTRCESDEPGQIAVLRPDPVMFLGYWNREKATRDKFLGDWMTTGDQGRRDQDGYVFFFGRDDDVISSSGYRIGPGEIEDCLLKHPAVQLAAAVGKRDAIRGEIVKAFIVPKTGFAPSPELATDIQNFVRERLSAHEYPREVAFIDQMPLTTTGKVIRRILRDQA
jgi:acetyl-CoA synthetase